MHALAHAGPSPVLAVVRTHHNALPDGPHQDGSVLRHGSPPEVVWTVPAPTRASRHYRGFPVYWRAITAFQRAADPYRMDQVLFWFALPPMFKNAPLLSPVPRERGPPTPGSDRRQPGKTPHSACPVLHP